MKTAVRAAAVTALAVVVLMMCACGSGITGKWRSTSEKQTQLAFSAAGRVTMSADGITMSGNYSTENDQLVMTLSAPDGEVYVIEATYEIMDKKLYLTNSKGQVEVFER